jgi:Na+-translocating ferredoxin:NAD+ oxidoreductase RnfC subunit
MKMKLTESVQQAGVVGAGGAGFPTHVKLEQEVEWYLANGAECEPLLHKDRELMIRYPTEIINGLRLAAEAVGAGRIAIGLKAKNKAAIEALRSAIVTEDIAIHEFGDFYPSGDEYELVYSITDRLIPPAGIPLDIGVVVNNVETLYQVHQASQGVPVTDTFLTIAGCVSDPLTTWVPIGMRISEVLELAGGTSISDFAVMESGLLMGRLVSDLDQPVTKTTAGLIVLPSSHKLIQRYTTSPEAMARLGKSACDQCSYCTELCPRYLLGYDVQPHAVMRSLGFSATGSEIWNEYALLCCGCGICTLYACPEALYPREACLDGIQSLQAQGRKWEGPSEVKVHPMKEARRVPMKQLITRLGVGRFEANAAYKKVEIAPSKVVLPFKQHTGNDALPVVSVGEMVKRGQTVAKPEAGALGAALHASIAGRITSLENGIEIQRKDDTQ